MADMLSTGVSGLLAFQRSLDTTSHNIANASTEGYSRQRAELLTRPADVYGSGWIGTGVDVSTVRRLYDTVLAGQARSAGSTFQQLDTFSTYAGRLDNLFSDTSTGLATTLQNFINSVQAVADAPASISSRQVLLSQAGALTTRLKSYNSSLDAINNQLNSQLNSEASTISTIASNIATLNQRIVAAQAINQQPANDLLDQRDKLLSELATHLAVSTVTQSNGAVSVFIGNGQTLVTNNTATRLAAVGDQYAATRARLVMVSANGATDVTDAVSGGTVGGLLQFRTTMLDPSRNSVGQAAVTLAYLVNNQQAAGLDLRGQVGGDLFAVGAVRVSASNLNAGSANASVVRSDPTALTNADYQLLYDGSAWQLSRVDTGAIVAMTGSGTVADPFVADGLSIVQSGAAQAGDRLLIEPTSVAVSGMSVLLTQPEKIAAAAMLLTNAAAANSGTASIDAGAVTSTAAWVRGDYTLTFTTPGTWQVTDASNSAVASGSYSSGSPISFNGIQVAVSGAAAAGDSFQIRDNANGKGDNRNALQIAALLNKPILNGATVSLSDSVGRLVGNIGVQTNQAQSSRDAQQFVMNDATTAMSNISGVNLDEEAANLVRYQQAYQAAAKVISVANSLFQTLLDATR
ncbi:MAG: flagellar hook-associated protein FlgK [Steroidobacteraceae bacterium]